MIKSVRVFLNCILLYTVQTAQWSRCVHKKNFKKHKTGSPIHFLYTKIIKLKRLHLARPVARTACVPLRGAQTSSEGVSGKFSFQGNGGIVSGWGHRPFVLGSVPLVPWPTTYGPESGTGGLQAELLFLGFGLVS